MSLQRRHRNAVGHEQRWRMGRYGMVGDEADWTGGGWSGMAANLRIVLDAASLRCGWIANVEGLGLR